MRLNKLEKKELLFSLGIAIEGQKWFRYKWDGEYGDDFRRKDGTNAVKKMRLNDIDTDTDRIYDILAIVEKA